MTYGKSLCVILWIGALVAAQPALAQVAGRVLLASGEAIAIRDGAELRLSAGDAVHDRDTLVTGPASNLQVRMTDESIIALRADSRLRIDEYRFAPSEERAFFRLLKGGFRALTGLIGRVNHRDYAVRTPTATVGIRGTNYSLAHCEGDCRNPDGSVAADGLYGTVRGSSYGTDKITTTNNAGEALIGLNEHFHIADANSLPMRLLEPPSFLLARLGSMKPTASAPAAAPVSGSGASAESRVSTLPEPITQTNLTTVQTQFVAAQTLQAGGLSAALTVNSAQVPVSFQPVGGSGEIRGQLVWLTNADMDLHLNAPNGAHIYYGNTSVTLPGGATAALDADNLGGTINVQPNQRIENIRVTGGTPPVGHYNFYVHAFSRGDTTTSVLTVTGDGGATGRTYNVPALPNRGTSQNYTVIYNGAGAAPGYSP
ncbi:MAG: hypothetical protein A3G81_29705 [Betaproteobacteria bacterium RIFCSPLOWO2_12_FULL_65_14]|nr:MAG: hypothetical protein A3G81_29705 [Betaproteobacteria bacterium RIFCSPLOWO2_12_FULL_65_14]